MFLLSMVLALVTVAVYLPVHHHPFFNLDDSLYVSGNAHVLSGLSWSTVRWAFTSFDMSNWVPLTFLSHSVDYDLFGLNPAGHHDVNVLFHTVNVLLLFWVLQVATGKVARSFMVAALFGLHPLNVEAVAWLAERKTVLSMVFFLAALGAYHWYARKPQRGRYAVVVVLFALGLMAKAQVITLPFVLLLWDYWPLGRMLPRRHDANSQPARTPALPARSFSRLVLEKVPLLFLCALDAAATLYSEHDARPALWPPISERLGNGVVSYVLYIKRAFWPSALAPLYPNRGNSLTLWDISVAAIFLLAVTAGVIAARRHRYLLVGWFWFLGTLVPTLEIVQFGKEGMADRFAYQALIGLFIMVTWGVADWAKQRHISPKWLMAASAAAVAALAGVTHVQVGYWKDDLTMWQHAADTVKGHWQAEDNIAVGMMHRGRTEAEVMPHFFRAAEMNPRDPVSNIHLAIYEQKNGRLREAIAHYDKVLLTEAPPQVEAQIYQNMGIAYSELDEAAKAQECFDKAVTLRIHPLTQPEQHSDIRKR